MDFVVIPNFAALGYIAGFSCINANQITYTFPMLRVLTDGNVNAVFVKHRSGIHFTWTFGSGVFVLLPVWRIAVILPNSFQKLIIPILHRNGIKGITPAITAAEQDLFFSVYHCQGRGTPLAVENSLADVG